MVGCAVLGVAIERFAYRPLRDAPRIAPLISALGVSFFLAYSMQLMFGAQHEELRHVLDRRRRALLRAASTSATFDVPLIRIITIVSAFVLMVAPLAARHADADRQGDARDVRTTARPPR